MKVTVLLSLSVCFIAFFANNTTLFKKESLHKSKKSMILNKETTAKNVLGTDLQACCFEPKTGWYRDGYCHTDFRDYGVHVVCAELTDDFLNYSSSCGNDLKTPKPQHGFPGLKAGDKWCLCISRWKEAMLAGVAPRVVLESTHIKALETVSLDELKKYEVAH